MGDLGRRWLLRGPLSLLSLPIFHFPPPPGYAQERRLKTKVNEVPRMRSKTVQASSLLTALLATRVGPFSVEAAVLSATRMP